MQQLPGEVRTALASWPIKDARALAREADNIFSVKQQGRAAVYNCANTETLPPGGAVVTATRQQAPPALCFYHARFGSMAKKCRPPCCFKESGNRGAGAH